MVFVVVDGYHLVEYHYNWALAHQDWDEHFVDNDLLLDKSLDINFEEKGDIPGFQ
jgi:hypothetical protein